MTAWAISGAVMDDKDPSASRVIITPQSSELDSILPACGFIFDSAHSSVVAGIICSVIGRVLASGVGSGSVGSMEGGMSVFSSLKVNELEVLLRDVRASPFSSTTVSVGSGSLIGGHTSMTTESSRGVAREVRGEEASCGEDRRSTGMLDSAGVSGDGDSGISISSRSIEGVSVS